MGTKKTTKRERELGLTRGRPKKNRLVILAAVVVAIIGVSIYLAVFGGSGGGSQNNAPIKATWIAPQVVADTVSIPVAEVESNRNVHFKVETQDNNMNFMAYVLNGEIYVRANICPPCPSVGFSLEGDILICNKCGRATTFNAKTGEGIKGTSSNDSCVNYPKAPVPYEIRDGNIVMKRVDLMTAYQDTIERGLP